MGNEKNEVWLLPEFRDRRDELIKKSDAAKLVGVAGQTLYSWEQRFRDFPPTVMECANGKYLHRPTFLEWHAKFKDGTADLIPHTVWNRAKTISERAATLEVLRQQRERAVQKLARIDERIAEAVRRLAQDIANAEKEPLTSEDGNAQARGKQREGPEE